MKQKYLIFSGLCWLLLTNQALGQIRPDQTLPDNSTIKSQEGIIQIEGGTQKGSNLFHSFQDFSILAGQEAFFNNPSHIQNILTRVTGNSISQIDGIIRANGTANLFFLNPNGIIFGSNASLNLGGSFVASTAQELLFSDGNKFSTKPENSSLLTISVPVGLGLSNQSGAIKVQNSGGNQILINPNPFFSPFIPDESLSNLQVPLGKSLALVARNIILEGARISSLAGRIDLVSIESGIVNLDFTGENLKVNTNFPEQPFFADLKILGKTFIDSKGGTINIQAKNVEVESGSIIALQNLETISGNMTILATESLKLSGTNLDGTQRTAILTEALGLGSTSGSLKIITDDLKIEDGAVIASRTFGAEGSDITISADNSIQISGVSPINPTFSSSITAITLTPGNAGDITIDTKKLKITDGGFISSGTFSSGAGGDLILNATDSVELTGVDPLSFVRSTLAATTLNSGNAGNLIINTATLKVLDGGRIDSSTVSTGNGGKIQISASDSIEVSGKSDNSFSISSSILSSADFLDPQLQELFQVEPLVTGNSGNIEIITNSLVVKNEGIISVTNQGSGTGNAGNININAENITLDTGSISATTLLGKGGNINLQAQDISLINNSNISATAGGQGDGGNININSDSLLMKDGSQITADAFAGKGGNILINTEVFLVSNDGVITATSELGIDGVVEINTPENNLESVIVPIKAQILELDPTVAQQCLNKKGEKGLFIIKGKDAIPTDNNSENFDTQSTPQFIDITENMSEAEKNFYNQHTQPNVILRTEKGDLLAINLCLRELLSK